jgi:hypothetical protein
VRETFLATAQIYVDAVGEDVVYRPHSVQPVEEHEIRAVVEDEFQVVQSGEVRLSSSRPRIYVTLESLEEITDGGPQEGDQVEVRGELMEVVTPQPDGQGGAMLTLKTLD